MSRWEVDGLAERITCYGRACTQSLRVSQAQSKDVMVRYLGPKEQGNRDPRRSDFITRTNGMQDFTVDPTWWENH